MGLFTSPLPSSGGTKKKLNWKTISDRRSLDSALASFSSAAAVAAAEATVDDENDNQAAPTLAPPLFHAVNNQDRQLLKNLKGTFSPAVGSRHSVNSDKGTAAAAAMLKAGLVPPLAGDDARGTTEAWLSPSKSPRGGNDGKNKTTGGGGGCSSNTARRFNQSFSVGSPSTVRMRVPLLPEQIVLRKDTGGSCGRSATARPTNAPAGSCAGHASSMPPLPPLACRGGTANNNDANKRSVGPSSDADNNNNDDDVATSSLSSQQQQQQQQQQPCSGQSIEDTLEPSYPLSPARSTSSSKMSAGSRNRRLPTHQQQQEEGEQQQQHQPPSYPQPGLSPTAASVHSIASDSCSYFEELIESDEEGDNGIALRATYSSDEYIEEIILEDGSGSILLQESSLGSLRGWDGNNRRGDDRQQGRPKIRFNGFDEVQMTLHMNDYTGQELKRSWYRREDYDAMIQLARTTVKKEEERHLQVLQQQQQQQPPTPAPPPSELETRGLEAWSSSGTRQVRQVKEAAIEAVWDEQHRQWDAGVHDPDSLRRAYREVSAAAQAVAQERAAADRQVADRIRQLDELATSEIVVNRRKRQQQQHPHQQQHQQRRSSLLMMINGGGSLLGKSVKAAGKVARETGRRSAKAGVGAFTLDPKMLLESIKIEKKKREARASMERRVFKRPSAAAAGLLSSRDDDTDSNCGDSLGSPPAPTGAPSAGRDQNGGGSLVNDEAVQRTISTVIKQKRERLKLLGLVPIPGTKKMYNDDRRERKIENRKRDSKKSGYATWEASLAAGGKL